MFTMNRWEYFLQIFYLSSLKYSQDCKNQLPTLYAAIFPISVIFTSRYSAGKMLFNIAKTRDFFLKLKEMML